MPTASRHQRAHVACSLLLLAGIFYLNFFSRIILAPLLPDMERSLALSHGQAGSFFLVLSGGYFLAQAGSGFISARLGHKQTIVLSMLTIGAILLLLPLTTLLPLIRIYFFLLGMAAGIYLPSGIATISDLFPQHQWGRAFAIHEVAPNLAFFTAPLLTAVLLPHLSWQQVLLLPGCAALGAAMLYGMLGHRAMLPGSPPHLAHCRHLLTLPAFWLMILLFSMGIAGTLGIYAVLPTFLVSVHGLSPEDANRLVGLSRLSTLVMALLGGLFSDRFGSRRTMAVVLLVTGLTTALLGLAPDDTVRLWVWLQPVVAVCFFPAAFALLARIGPPEIRNVVVSLVIPFSFVIGGGSIPALITHMADRGYFATGLLLTGLFISSGSLVVHLVRSSSQEP